MENIQVALRLRPINQKEEDAGETVPWKIKSNCIEIDRSLTEAGAKKGIGKQQFFYDHCFPGHTTNDQVYQSVAKKVIMSCLEGYNGTIFMYGQTGSGKTYTMLGYKNQDGVYNQGLTEDAKTKAMLKEDQKLEKEGEDGEQEDGLHEKFADYMYDSNKVDMAGNTGILIQSLKDMFKTIEQDEEKTYFLKCSYFEIYNDQIYDLLAARNTMHESLNLMEDAKKDHFMIKGLTEHSVTSIKEIFEKLKKGEVNRHYAQTFMNHSSSRSHTLFRVTVKAVTNNFIRNYRQENKGKSNVNLHHFLAGQPEDENAGTIVTESYLNFVDLAGSERISSHMKWIDDEMVDENVKEMTKAVQDSRMKEGKSINKSLFFLTQVISLKAEGKANQYIPFRNSPLTKILRSSLGGNFRTLVVLCVNPCISQVEISLSTLRFGANAKKIQNNIRANIVTNNNDESIKILIENYEKKMRDIQNQRDEDLARYQHFTTIIDELRMQRSLLLERLEQANKKLSVHIVESIPEKELYAFFKQAQTKVAVVGEAGLVFVPKNQSKYDQIHDTDVHDEDAHHLKRKFDHEMRISSKDFVNKFALQAYNKVKKDFEELKGTVQKHQEYIIKLCESFKTLSDFMGHLSSLGETYLAKLHTMSEQYQDEYLLANERHLKLELLEKFKGMSLLPDPDLSKMKEYIAEFQDSVQSEFDRRELLKNSDLPPDVIEGLNVISENEKDEQEQILDLIKEKMTSFVIFRQGCSAEIDYYRQMCKDFTTDQGVIQKAKQIENFINNDMVGLTNKVKMMEENFKETDVQLATHDKKTIDKKLAEYQTKFEKLVDVVLSQRPGAAPNRAKERLSERPGMVRDDLSVKESPEASPGTQSKRGFMRKSQSINFDEEKELKGPERFDKAAHNKKIRQWMTLKAIEEEPMCYNSMIRDDESVRAGSVQAGLGQPYMSGNNLAIINEKVSNDGDVSEKSFGFDMKGKIKAKYAGGNESPAVRMEERKSHIVGGNYSQVSSPKRGWDERRSHIVGRTNTENPFTLIATPLLPAKYDQAPPNKSGFFGSVSTLLDHGKKEEKKNKTMSDKTQMNIALLQAFGGVKKDKKEPPVPGSNGTGNLSPSPNKSASQKEFNFVNNEQNGSPKNGDKLPLTNRNNGGLENISSCSSDINGDKSIGKSHSPPPTRTQERIIKPMKEQHHSAKPSIGNNSKETGAAKSRDPVRNINIPGPSKNIPNLPFGNDSGGPSASSTVKPSKGKDFELSHRQFGNNDKERVSYKSHHNGRDVKASQKEEDVDSVENVEVKINSPSLVQAKSNPQGSNLSKSITVLQRNKSNEALKESQQIGSNITESQTLKTNKKENKVEESGTEKQSTGKKTTTAATPALKKGSVRDLVAAAQSATPLVKEEKAGKDSQPASGQKNSGNKEPVIAKNFDMREGQRESVTSIAVNSKPLDSTKKTSVRELLTQTSPPNKKTGSFLADSRSTKDLLGKNNSRAELVKPEDSKAPGRKSAEPATTTALSSSKQIPKEKEPQPDFYKDKKQPETKNRTDPKQASSSVQAKRPATASETPDKQSIVKPEEPPKNVASTKVVLPTESTAGSSSKAPQPRGQSATATTRPGTSSVFKTTSDKKK